MGRVAGRVALVTGAAHEDGIGHGIASVLLAEGASVVVTDLDVENGKASTARLQERFGEDRVLFLRHDVTREADWAGAIKTTVEQFGGLDILVNNAGTLVFGTLETLSLDGLRQVMAVNLESQFIGIKAAIPALEARAKFWPGGASIVNIVSLASHMVDPDNMAYHISKAASRKLTQCAAKELAPKKIRVNSIHPGMVESQLVRRHLDHFVEQGRYASREAAKAFVTAMKPLGCLAEAEDMGAAVAYLASDDAKYVVGIALHVDGGMLMQY